LLAEVAPPPPRLPPRRRAPPPPPAALTPAHAGTPRSRSPPGRRLPGSSAPRGRFSTPAWASPRGASGAPAAVSRPRRVGAARALAALAPRPPPSPPPSCAGPVPLGLYAAQLALNFAWSPLFFKRHALGAAAVDITVLLGVLVTTILEFKAVDATAAALMLPYLGWTVSSFTSLPLLPLLCFPSFQFLLSETSRPTNPLIAARSRNETRSALPRRSPTIFTSTTGPRAAAPRPRRTEAGRRRRRWRRRRRRRRGGGNGAAAARGGYCVRGGEGQQLPYFGE
jgi:hypothetical protein